jgi:putative acetyltransferase
MKIILAKTEDMETVRKLFKEYQIWLGLDLTFQDFENELENLPGCYSQPKGAVFILKENDNPIGCVAIRPFSATEAELKRMYIHSSYRGKGYAKHLLNHALGMAKSAGYKSVVLDTLPTMTSAKSLYLKYGFKPITAYYESPLASTEYYRYVYA